MNLEDSVHRGMRFADTNDQERIHADNPRAISGVVYYCPHCKARMYHTHRGEYMYFALMPGEEHKNDFCKRVDAGKAKEHSAPDSPEEFFTRLVSEPLHKGTQRTGDERKESFPTATQDKTRALTSLKQIIDEKLYLCKPHYDFDGKDLSDYVINYRHFDLLSNPNLELNGRVVHVAFDYGVKKEKIVVFVMYSSQNGRTVRWRFALKLNNFDEYDCILKNFNNWFTDQNGKVKRESQECLIASDNWDKRPYPSCREICTTNHTCDGCLGMFLTRYSSPRQFRAILSKDDASEQYDW